MTTPAVISSRCVGCGQVQPHASQQEYADFIAAARLCRACQVNQSTRAGGHLTSLQAAMQSAPAWGTERYKLLREYGSGLEMNPYEAMMSAPDVDPDSCWWHRVSDLEKAGLLVQAGYARPGRPKKGRGKNKGKRMPGTPSNVLRITPAGVAVLAMVQP